MPHNYDNIPDNMKLVIWIDEKGVPRIHGPIADKLMCYALLEIAKDLIREYNKPKQTEQLTNGEVDRLASKPSSSNQKNN